MATERFEKEICQCLCGTGVVNESFWANDHPFASDYSWHSSGIELDCKTCSADWVVRESVSNPVPTPPDRRVIYFVRKEELRTITLHNEEIERRLALLHEEESRIKVELNERLRRLRNELLELLSQDSRITARFQAVGALLNIPNIVEFRTKVGKTRPATYIPKLVGSRNMEDILRRLNRGPDAELIHDSNGRIAQIIQNVAELNATKRLPIAADHRMGTT